VWWYKFVLPNTQYTRTRTIVCARNTNSPRIYTVYTGRLLATAPKSHHTLTDFAVAT